MPTRRRRKRTRALHGFTIGVERKSRLRLHVLIYRTIADLQKAAREVDGTFRGEHARTTAAWTKSIRMRHKKSKRLHPIFASVAFGADDLRPRYVVHEAFHATLRWAARRGWSTLPLPPVATERRCDLQQEERMAEVCDEICRAIFVKLYALKVWK